MEAQVSEILENILSLLALEGSFEVEEKEDGVFVSIDTEDAGRLIGHQGETLGSLQLIVNLIVSRANSNHGPKTAEGAPEGKRVIVDIASWKQGKEEELAHKARTWADQVKQDQRQMELEPMPAWQRRIVHMTIQETEGVESESIGEGEERHLIIRPVS